MVSPLDIKVGEHPKKASSTAMGQEEGSSWGYTRGKGVDGRTKGGSGAPVPSCRPLGTQVTEEHPSAQPHLLPSPKDTSVSDQLTPEMAERSAFPPSPHSLFLLWIYDSATKPRPLFLEAQCWLGSPAAGRCTRPLTPCIQEAKGQPRRAEPMVLQFPITAIGSLKD